MKTTLVIAAHPDDEVLGCGGMISHKSFVEKYSPRICFLSDGVGSRADWSLEKKRKKKEQAISALKTLGVKKYHIFYQDIYPDNQFDTHPLLSIIKSIEKILLEVQPDVIYTHSRHDLNIDHRITHQAVLTATRPWSSSVEEIYSFEVPSSTEWNFPTKFSPNVFYTLSRDDIGRKQKALKEYKYELCDYPHPRSKKGVMINAQNWGMKSGTDYAEAFELVRMIK